LFEKSIAWFKDRLPYTYLVELFRQLPLAKTIDDFEALLPWQLVEPKIA
jgi:hypothetical protein